VYEGEYDINILYKHEMCCVCVQYSVNKSLAHLYALSLSSYLEIKTLLYMLNIFIADFLKKSGSKSWVNSREYQ